MESDRKSGKKVTRDSQCLVDIPENSDTTDINTTGLAAILGTSNTNSDVESRKTFRIEPPTDLLSRLNAFLPQIAEANKQLEAAVADDPRKLDIENIDKDEEQYIEMDLGLGVFDMKPKKDIKSIDGILIHDIPETAKSDDDDENRDADSDVDQDVIYGSSSRVIISPSSILKRNKGLRPPGIKVIGGSDAQTSSTSESSSDDNSDSSTDSSSDSESDPSSQSSSDNDITMAD
ncbi:hypothetical protein J3B02_006511 [Coemansia erecta]|uniref:Uncharacterized protein n=1 Tax=Coemansia asiatica TaxID=1052880 RepID=A0A9W8CJY7_9FUNG|nr:hypothetical protein LPJ64_002153 [Coemansia asiatica]KAJ2836193.1 hypothetical protein J3B02_006511 [Coemansia erecta]KAJ2886299.1 hypothetical protein FB639_001604 [Coemansia asiatica]